MAKEKITLWDQVKASSDPIKMLCEAMGNEPIKVKETKKESDN